MSFDMSTFPDLSNDRAGDNPRQASDITLGRCATLCRGRSAGHSRQGSATRSKIMIFCQMLRLRPTVRSSMSLAARVVSESLKRWT